jgi:hypothetical protein
MEPQVRGYGTTAPSPWCSINVCRINHKMEEMEPINSYRKAKKKRTCYGTKNVGNSWRGWAWWWVLKNKMDFE